MPPPKKPETPGSARKPPAKPPLSGSKAAAPGSKPATGSPTKAATGPRRSTAAGAKDAPPARGATPQPQAGPSAAAPPLDEFLVPVRDVVRPSNQLQLSEKELGEEVARTLTANNPLAPANLARYSLKDRCYRAEPLIDQLLQHFTVEGCLAVRGPEEAARDQRDQQRRESAAASRRATAMGSRRVTEMSGGGAAAGAAAAQLALGTLPPGDPADPAQPQASSSSVGADGRKLRNQFNSVDRGAQTGHHPPKERQTMTDSPPTATTSGSCTKWEIYDAYIDDHERQRQQEEAAKRRAAVARKGQAAAAQAAEPAKEDTGAATVPRAAAVLERMVNQNIYSEVIMDFKYWDDPTDGLRAQEGTLLPLWEFAAAAAKHRHVTALCWNPQYFDLFAVGYGSYDFQRPTTGLLCCYTLKNPSTPEVVFTTTAGVMCLAFHPDYPNLLAVGCYDGAVLIFDVRLRTGRPLYASTARSGKHTEPVWQVSWQRTGSHELQLYSISTDGRVTLWSVSKNELSYQDLLQLRLPGGDGQENRDDNEHEREVAGGTCFDFNPDQDYVFAVGTEEGRIFKCSTAYNSEYLQTYSGHGLPVYAVRWNSLHSRIFLSGSADWTVKLWDSLAERPVMSFDLGSPVGDAAWAPFSSTVFAAVTEAGRVFVFDLAQNMHSACCVQKVTKKTKLTKLAFNAQHPILLVGNDRGGVTCFKLSPNLRKHVFVRPRADPALARSESQRQSEARALEEEAGRLEGVLATARRNVAQLEDL